MNAKQALAFVALTGTFTGLLTPLSSSSVNAAPQVQATTKTAVPSSGNTSLNSPTLRSATAAAAVDQYWTSQRLSTALPTVPPRVANPRLARLAPQQRVAAPTSPIVSAPGGAPASALTKELANQVANGLKSLGVPQPLVGSFISYFVSYTDYTKYPNSTVGKLFFVHGGNGGNYVCSASAVNSTNQRLIITAGHCVSDGAGRFHRNFLFIPAYRPDLAPTEPFRRWTTCGVYVRTSWHTRRDFGQDMGALKACDQGTQRLHNTTGYLGYVANASRSQTWRAFGYPAAAPFNGRRMVACLASLSITDSAFSPATNGIGCNMTGGSSGGPWILRYAQGVGGAVNQINGLNSYGYGSLPNTMFSPYFGNEFLSLRSFAIASGS